jgi:transcriptional accessory protein Tex/SPT6
MAQIEALRVDFRFAPARYLTNALEFRIKVAAAVAATRGDLGQLAPRKKLLKSCRVSQKNF